MNDRPETAKPKRTPALSKAEEALKAARQKAQETTAAARQRAREAAQGTRSGIDHNPIAAVAGGLAIGAIAAALLPRTEREDRLVGDVGRKVRSAAAGAAAAARETGKEQLSAMGLNSEAAKTQAKELIGKVAKAATSAASAAGESIKKPPSGEV
jgi:ElaB/YqjD/DUF883 family membrane-anchored ribosome-binding protein